MQLICTNGEFHHHHCLFGQPQTINRIVESCLLTRLVDYGLLQLHSADDMSVISAC